jgi:adenylate kinase family enzyme
MPVSDVEHASIIGFKGWVQVGHGPVYHPCAAALENELDRRRQAAYEVGGMAPGRSEFFKTVIVGNSGSGKSWLAERLAEGLGTVAIDLDSIHWVPGGYNCRRDPDLAKSMVRDQASKDCWVIEGVYGWLAYEALPSATAFIWLDLPEAECIENIRGRGLRQGGDEASFEALIAWAGEYRIRDNANSFTGHSRLFELFKDRKFRLRSRAEIADLVRTLS